MMDFDCEKKKVTLRVNAEEIIGRLLVYYQCPNCHEHLRFIALFEDVSVAEGACEKMFEVARKMEVVRSGRAVVATSTYMSMYGPRAHGGSYYGSYGRGCNLLPYYGTERELARSIWKQLCGHEEREDGSVPWGRIELTRLPSVMYAEDQVGSGPPLLLYESSLQYSPEDIVIGRWNPRSETFDDWMEKRKKAPELFLQSILPIG